VVLVTAELELRDGSRIVTGFRGQRSLVRGQLEVEQPALVVGDPEMVA
jgi:hypothetical protein